VRSESRSDVVTAVCRGDRIYKEDPSALRMECYAARRYGIGEEFVPYGYGSMLSSRSNMQQLNDAVG